jgi:hypothetical protein
MKRLIIIATMMISLVAFGQDAEKTQPSNDFKRLIVGINVSPDYCFRTLSSNGGSIAATITGLRNDQEEPKFGYTAGLNVCYNITKHFGFEMGVQYSNKGFETKETELTYGDPIDNRYGFVFQSSGSPGPTKIKFIYNHTYLDIPIRAIYSFGEKRVHFLASVGIATNIFLNATTTSVGEYANGETKRQTRDQMYKYEAIDLSPIISIGADYRISNKINLRAEPTFRYGLLTIVDAPITANLWSAGLNITCYYALK